ncbi:MAG: isoprenylcysteine carboxylmethyltransferase family protein [endosymbiont of Galathealinum brachiosum]|uniref:Isoprenylcysteine carboxylmethyltransferase family protein n=1 Tax=endosymbiont of Galathealinum brachiosum TaxID=2200906 RepID=A0A370DGE4_9GAMM|nr:MAG: isoprenylcysteine carboxylmethyltransferase family protein [endosymbiont of Galathealinum brachiosum]
MSRADKVSDATGLEKLILTLRYHEQSRQWFAVIFVLLVSLLGSYEPMLFIVGGAIAVFGELIRMWASGYVMKNKELATTGPYAYVRHPLYVGNILLLIGFSIASTQWWSFVLMIALLAFYYPPTISYEDNKLRDIFGDEWIEWSKNINALIPTFGSKAGSVKSSWSFKKSLMQNAEPVIVVYLIGCLYLLYTS